MMSDRTSLSEMCSLRRWCYNHVRCNWRSYFMGTSDHNRMNGVGFVVFEFDDPREHLKFKLWVGA